MKAAGKMRLGSPPLTEEDSLDGLELRYLQAEMDLSELEKAYQHRKATPIRAPSPSLPPLTIDLQEALLGLFQVLAVEPPAVAEMSSMEQIPSILRRATALMESKLGEYRTQLETRKLRETQLKEREEDLHSLLSRLEEREQAVILFEKANSDTEKRISDLKSTLLEQQNKLQEDSQRLKQSLKAVESTQADLSEKDKSLTLKLEYNAREEEKRRVEGRNIAEQWRELETLKGEIMADQRKVMDDRDKVAKQLIEIDQKSRQLKGGIEAFIKERQEQSVEHKRRKAAVKEAHTRLKAKDQLLKQREAESAELMKDIQKEHERLLKETEDRSHFFKAMEESLASKELELAEERQELEELTKDLAGIKRDLESQQDELMHQLNVRQSNVEHQEQVLEIRSKELESQGKSLEDELTVVQEIKAEVEKTQREVDEGRRAWMNKVAVKESELAGMRAELENGKKRLEDDEKRINEQRALLAQESKKTERAEATEILDLKTQIAKLRSALAEKEESMENSRIRESKLRAEMSQKEGEISRKEISLQKRDEQIQSSMADIQEREKKLSKQLIDLQYQEAKTAESNAQFANFLQAKADFERYREEIAREIEAELTVVRKEKSELENAALVLEKVHEDLNRAKVKNERDSRVIAADFQRIREMLAQMPWKSHEDLADQKLLELDEKVRIEEGESAGNFSLLSISSPLGSREGSLRP